jgi:hypothetical protein
VGRLPILGRCLVAIGLFGSLAMPPAQAQNAIQVSATSISLAYTLLSEVSPSTTIKVSTTAGSTPVAVSIVNPGNPVVPGCDTYWLSNYSMYADRCGSFQCRHQDFGRINTW